MPTREVVKNSVLNLLDITFLSDRVRARPSIYGTAVSTTCNLRCPHCMREALGIRENEFMDFEAFARQAEDLKYARKVSLFGLGEPFLHPRFFDFVRLCKGLGVQVITSTHGMSLTPEVREQILASGIDEIGVSMDGADKRVFEELRVGADFQTVVDNVRALVGLRRERGVDRPALYINMTVLRRNVHQIPEMVRLAHRMGVSAVSFSSVVIYKEADRANNVLGTPEFEMALSRGRELSRRLGIRMIFWRQKPFGWEPDVYAAGSSFGCVMMWSDQILERDGQMKLCCYIEEDVADAFKLGLAEAFNCEEIRRQRRLLMEGRVRPECQGCVYLRERTPYWMQAQINLARRQTLAAAELTDEDRRELLAEIDRVQAQKDSLYPRHGHRPVEADGAPDGASTPLGAAAELPTY